MKYLVLLLFLGVLFSQDANMTPEEYDKAVMKQEQRENNIRIQEENKRWKEDKMRLQQSRHHKIRMKHKMNVHKKDERKKKFKRKIKQRRLINFLMGMVVGYHIGVK
jgi:phage terminase small subunit